MTGQTKGTLTEGQMETSTSIMLQIGDDTTELKRRIKQRARLLPALNEVVYGNQNLQVPVDLALIVRRILEELRKEAKGGGDDRHG